MRFSADFFVCSFLGVFTRVVRASLELLLRCLMLDRGFLLIVEKNEREREGEREAFDFLVVLVLPWVDQMHLSSQMFTNAPFGRTEVY